MQRHKVSITFKFAILLSYEDCHMKLCCKQTLKIALHYTGLSWNYPGSVPNFLYLGKKS